MGTCGPEPAGPAASGGRGVFERGDSLPVRVAPLLGHSVPTLRGCVPTCVQGCPASAPDSLPRRKRTPRTDPDSPACQASGRGVSQPGRCGGTPRPRARGPGRLPPEAPSAPAGPPAPGDPGRGKDRPWTSSSLGGSVGRRPRCGLWRAGAAVGGAAGAPRCPVLSSACAHPGIGYFPPGVRTRDKLWSSPARPCEARRPSFPGDSARDRAGLGPREPDLPSSPAL